VKTFRCNLNKLLCLYIITSGHGARGFHGNKNVGERGNKMIST